MQDTTSDIVYQLHSQITQCDRRLSRLQVDADDAELLVLRGAELQDSFKDSALGDIAIIEKGLVEVNVLLKDVSSLATKVSGRFRQLVKDVSLQEIDKRVDDWPVESFINREEFYSLLQDSFSR